MINVSCREKEIHIKEYYASDGDQEYRYLLSRYWDKGDKVVSVLMCNPSDASYLYEDRTSMNVNNYFVNLGYNKINIINLFAFRDKDFKKLKNRSLKYESQTNFYLNKAMEESDLIVVAWGYGKEHKDQPKYIKEKIQEVKNILKLYKHKNIKCMDEGKGNIHPLKWDSKVDVPLIDYIL